MQVQEPIHADLSGLYEKLRISEAQFRGAFEYAAIGMAIVAPDGKWIEVNKSLCKMLGYTAQQMMGLSFQDLTHPQDLNKDLKSLNKLLKGKSDSYNMEKRYFHKNGEVIYAILSVSIVRNQDGIPLHFVSQIIDITEIKKTEKKLQSVLEVTRDQNNRLLNFAQIVSHNLRSHSGNMSMLIRFLEMEENEAERAQLLMMLREASSNLEDTTSRLAEIASINNSSQDNLKTLDLLNVVNDALGNIQGLLREQGGVYVNEVPEGIQVKAIPAYIDSAILNLLTNAIKYRSDERKLIILISVSYEDDFVVLAIRDNGLGIDLRKNSEHIFGMYKTFHANEDARGLGLFIARNQMEGMGGKIRVESELGRGTVFKLYIKRA